MTIDDKAFEEFYKDKKQTLGTILQEKLDINVLKMVIRQAFEAGIKHQEQVENERKDALGIPRPDGIS